MANDMDDAFIVGDVDAAQHRKDYEHLIESEKVFTKKKDFEAFEKQYKSTALAAPVVARTKKNTDSSKVDQFVSMMNVDDEVDCFHGRWTTTSDSLFCVIIIRVMN